MSIPPDPIGGCDNSFRNGYNIFVMWAEEHYWLLLRDYGEFRHLWVSPEGNVVSVETMEGRISGVYPMRM